MPSLRSIGVHPQLQEKLAALKPPIETPQALLSRDAASLAESLNVPIHIIDSVRSAVADALISSTKDGKRSLRVSVIVNEEEAEVSKPLLAGSLSALEYLLYQQQTCKGQSILSGSKWLDRLLGIDDNTPGLAFGNVTQLTGPPSSGKTQVALAFAAHHAERGGKVVYLASDFGHGTILPLARRLSHYASKENYQRILTNVHFSPIRNGYQAMASLLQLEDDDFLANDFSCLGSLLILDSASGILTGDLYAGGDGNAGKIIARQLALQLKKMVRNYNLSALVTNGTVSGSNGNKPAMGQVWQVADIALWLEVLDGFDETASTKTVRARIDKHPFRAWHRKEPSQLVEFGITTSGIVDVSMEQTGEISRDLFILLPVGEGLNPGDLVI